MKVACFLIDHLPFKLEAALDPMLFERHVIIFKRYAARRIVVDVTPSVQEVVPGMELLEAQSKCNDAVLVEANIPKYEKVFDRLLLRLSEWSPVVESAGLGCAYIGLDGLENTYGNEERLISGLLQVAPQHLEPRLGVSQSKFLAYLAAMIAPSGRAYRPSNLKKLLVQASVDVLPVSWEVKARLRNFGFHTLGQVADLQLGPVQAQFGYEGVKLWKLANGVDDSPIFPRNPKEEIIESFIFTVPIVNIGPLLMAIENLLDRIFAKPEMRGRYARIAILDAQVLRRPPWQRRFVFKRLIGYKEQALYRIKMALDSIAFPGPLEGIDLTLKGLTGDTGWQGSLFQETRKGDRLREAIAQLKVSNGYNPICQVREVEPWSRIPERQRALMPYEP